jgi:hypothetical protein
MGLWWLLAIIVADALIAIAAGPAIAAAVLLVGIGYLMLRTLRTESGRVGFRVFVATPSRARTRLTAGGLIAGILVLALVTKSVLPLVIWGAVILGVGFLMLDDSTAAVTNSASILAGRPIAPTARGRKRITLDHITPERRRQSWLSFLTMLGIVVFAGVLAIVHG